MMLNKTLMPTMETPLCNLIHTSTTGVNLLSDEILQSQRLSQATYRDSSGIFQIAGIRETRLDHDSVGSLLGLLIEPSRSNKLTMYTANTLSVSGIIKGSNTSITIVNDASELASAGLGSLCGDENVYKMISTDSNTHWCVLPGSFGNTNAHSASIFVRTSGSGLMHLEESGGLIGSSNFSNLTEYTRLNWENFTPTDAAKSLAIVADSTLEVYFILPQLEEGSFTTSPILNNGSETVRALDIYSAHIPFNTHGVFYGEFNILAPADTDQTLLNLTNSTQNNSYQLIWDGSAEKAAIQYDLDGTIIQKQGTATHLSTSFAAYYGQAKIAASFDSATAVSQNVSIPDHVWNSLHIGNNQDGSSSMYGHFSTLCYLSQNVSNKGLEDIQS